MRNKNFNPTRHMDGSTLARVVPRARVDKGKPAGEGNPRCAALLLDQSCACSPRHV